MSNHKGTVHRGLALVLGLALASCLRATDESPAPPVDRVPEPLDSPAEPAKPPSGNVDPFLAFATTAPRVGEPAPAFELGTLEGESVSLANALTSGPVVLVFASFTCPPARMKLPGFDALAQRWDGKASVYVVYSREAHAHAKSSERLNGFADQVYARDQDGDDSVTVAEYGDLGPRYMFDAFDLDHDGEVRSYEFIAARRLDQFEDIDAPTTFDERFTLALRLREEVPGTVPLLVDGFDDAVATAYGGLPNMAYVIDSDGRVAFKLPWAAVGDVERELVKITGVEVARSTSAAPDLALVQPQLAAARAAGRPLLLEFSATGCRACVAMAKTLAEPELQPDLARYDLAPLAIEHDAEWRLFEALQLAATPALVALSSDGSVLATLQGAHDRDAVRAFLQRHAGS